MPPFEMSQVLMPESTCLNSGRHFDLQRSRFASAVIRGDYRRMRLEGLRSSCSYGAHIIDLKISDANCLHRSKRGARSLRLRVEAARSDRKLWTSSCSGDAEALGYYASPAGGLRLAASTALALGLSLLVHHGTASSAEAAASIVVGTFPWEKPQVLVQPEPSKGSCATCIGVVDETLGTCNSTPNCVSSFDDRPNFFVAPWEFPGQLSDAVNALKETLSSMGADIIAEPEERYVHAKFIDKEDGVIDDVEFLFSNPSEDATVVIRAASRAQGTADKARNRERLERIRSSLTWEEVPILRNRSRTLFFLESPWDSFGPEPPPTYDYKEGLEFVPE
ncbi:hypothetical protein AXG93_2818s1070 [Marchantia polymorpha subsp. ruderalis]|uniref:Uncharacterized protein n=1 Tax=Marchantia polymorpha subsp. ruderalis TaxID=1480154 RepID=A0A176VXA2_MARPO|nr:hypothetical protein AXG93_2818s1070 [Marchantia polymorpha subsp. ruderalis]